MKGQGQKEKEKRRKGIVIYFKETVTAGFRYDSKWRKR